MIEKLRLALQQSSLSKEEVQHILFLLFCGDSNQHHIPDNLINAGYVIVDRDRYILTDKGKIYRDSLLQKLAAFHCTSETIFRKYFDNELSPIKKQIETLKKQWRDARDRRLKYKETLIKQGKDKVAIRKDNQYRQLQKEQDELRTRMRHAEKEYNKKLSAYIMRLGNINH